MYLVTSEQMQAIDKHAMETLRVPGIVLMADAGKEVAKVVARIGGSSVCILCGKGNNGGDGYIVARWLIHWGWDVTVISIVLPETLSGDALVACQMAAAQGIAPIVYDDLTQVPTADVYVDALLGTGARNGLSGLMAQLVTQVNTMSKCTVSIDIPSGVNATTGEVSGVVVNASRTVAIGAQKLGTAVTPGCLHAGLVEVVDIGTTILSQTGLATAVDREAVKNCLPLRYSLAHKGSFGKTGVILGDMQGAAMLAGLAAYRVGTGLVVLGASTEMRHGVPFEFVVRAFAGQDAYRVVEDCNSIVVGPGLGSSEVITPEFFRSYAGRGVIDADALCIPHFPLEHPNWVLTPHPKECARLLGWRVFDVQARRFEAARRLASTTNAVVALKGFRTVIASPDGQIRVNFTGDATLSKAGTGDVLAGMIGGLLAQGLSPMDAAAAGVWLHGIAGELAGQASHKISALATDVLDNISRAISLCFDTVIPG